MGGGFCISGEDFLRFLPEMGLTPSFFPHSEPNHECNDGTLRRLLKAISHHERKGNERVKRKETETHFPIHLIS